MNCQEPCTQCKEYTKECHNVHGCICLDGYTGADCGEDIDECNDNKTATNCTGDNVVCVNTLGSYVCQCQSGYERNDTNHCGKI